MGFAFLGGSFPRRAAGLVEAYERNDRPSPRPRSFGVALSEREP